MLSVNSRIFFPSHVFFILVNPHIQHNWANKLMHVKLAMTTSTKVNIFFGMDMLTC
jgi:hypothetical protein